MSPSKVLLFCSIFFITGVALGSFLPQLKVEPGAFVVLAVLMLGFLSHAPRSLLMLALCFFIFAVGFMIAMEAESKFSPQDYILKRSGNIPDFIIPLRDKFLQVSEENLAPTQDEIIKAMILGDNQALSFDLKEKLNFSGLRHVIAISGMHITLLTIIFLELFLMLGMWRQYALFLSIIAIIFYILLVGAPASGMRAAIMGGLLAFAQAFGRLPESSKAVIVAAALMLVFDPLVLKHDIGFQLSFLATLGIVHLSPVLQHWFGVIPEKTAHIRNIISMTLAAQIFTLPLLVYHFGYVSLVSILSNLLLMPIVPLMMIAALVFLMAGAVFSPFGWLTSLLLSALLSYMTFVIDTFSSFSLSALWVELSVGGLIISYLILIVLTWHLKRRHYFATLPF